MYIIKRVNYEILMILIGYIFVLIDMYLMLIMFEFYSWYELYIVIEEIFKVVNSVRLIYI